MAVPVDLRPGPLSGSRSTRPPGPRIFSGMLRGRPFQNPLDFMLEARSFGDLVHYRILGRDIYQLNHPDLIADLFLRDAPHHHRNFVMQRSRDILGHGLLTSEEPLHMRQRRLTQPAFLRDRIASYGAVIGTQTLGMSARWRPGPIDIHPHMMELALRIVGKCLFDLDQLDDVAAMASAVDSFMNFVPLSFLPFSKAIERLPVPAMRRLRRAKAFLDSLIYTMIAARRADPRDRGDLLSMLLNATDDESGASAAMSDRQLRDECVTIILAGHETTANALSFALDLLARHPDIQDRLAAEAHTVLGARSPTAADYPALPFATQVFAEAMRLYPPVWVTGRTCVEPYEIAGFPIPRGATLFAPQFVIHHDPRFFPDPERFDPGRFTPENKLGRPRYAYFPFAGGSRQCIAEGLAWMEGTLALAAIVRDWRLTLPTANTPPPKLRPSASLRPARGIPLTLTSRT